jgi:hypothetical protein
VDEPCDREAEHAQEHPGADGPRRRLACERGAALRVEPQRDQQRYLCEQPVEVEEALVAPSALDEVRAEERVDVDGPERELVRDGGRVEEERAQCEEGEGENRDR